jgi:hypothetical protein
VVQEAHSYIEKGGWQTGAPKKKSAVSHA